MDRPRQLEEAPPIGRDARIEEHAQRQEEITGQRVSECEIHLESMGDLEIEFESEMPDEGGEA